MANTEELIHNLNIIDAKLEKAGKALDYNILCNLIALALCFINFFFKKNISLLPKIAELIPDQYLELLPIFIVIIFIRFGFISLSGLRLMSQRDSIIFLMCSEEDRILKDMARLKHTYHLSSFLEVYYRTMVFKGINYKDFTVHRSNSFKLFAGFWIVSVNVSNTLFLLEFLYNDWKTKEYLLLFILSLGIVTIFALYIDYLKKTKKIRLETKQAYDQWQAKRMKNKEEALQ